MSKLTWYAVVVELTPEIISGDAREFGRNPKTGTLLAVDFQQHDKVYSVAFKCGGALLSLAEEKAKKYGGFVVTVKSDYQFKLSDIDLTLPEFQAA